jgi:lysophospholipid acyltransferase (LPLAT)-like uncharacterized protein
MSTKPRLIIMVLAILLVVVLAIVGATTKAQVSQANTQVILNLLNGRQASACLTCTKATILVNQQVNGRCTMG